MTELAQNVSFESEMASNPAAPFGIEFSNVEDFQGATPANASDVRSTGAHAVTQRMPRPRHLELAGKEGSPLESVAPFAALAARHGRPLKVAILSDFIRIPYANGAAFQTRFLYQELRRCGHEVTVIGPYDPEATPDEIPPGTVALPSVPLKMYPGVHIPLPLASWVYDASRWDFDIVFAQTTSLLMEFGVWLRKMKGIPLLCVNTTHLAAAYEVLIPERFAHSPAVHLGLELALKRPYENLFASIYNNSDGLVVLSEGLRAYWRERGVTAPIHVIPRAVQPDIFDKPLGPDPYAPLLAKNGASNEFVGRGSRLLCAGRHTREKSQDRVIRIFARHIAKADADATLTLLGEGPDTAYYKRVAREEGVEDRVIFAGEVPFSQMPDFYAYADVFVHASLSETYGNVLGEALWCGTPTVAFADGMGVSGQIKDGVSGVLLSPGRDEASIEEADRTFARAVLDLLADPQRRAQLSKGASKAAHDRGSPEAVQAKIAAAFTHAQEHASACGLKPAIYGSMPLRAYTTFRHFKTWTAFMSAIYLAGHLRPANSAEKREAKRKSELHPQIASK